MGKQKKKQKKRGNPLWTLVFLAALAVFCFSGYKLIGIYLDYKTGKQVLGLLQETCRKTGRTVIVITHNTALTAMADRVIQVRSGQIVSNKVNEHPVPVEEIEW